MSQVTKSGIDFFFDCLKWIFSDFLMKVKVLDIPVLYYFLAIAMVGILIGGLLNTVQAGVSGSISSNQRRRYIEEARSARQKKGD